VLVLSRCFSTSAQLIELIKPVIQIRTTSLSSSGSVPELSDVRPCPDSGSVRTLPRLFLGLGTGYWDLAAACLKHAAQTQATKVGPVEFDGRRVT